MVTRPVDAEYARWLQRNATTTVLIYSGIIAFFLPAFHYVLAALPGVPPGSDWMPLRLAVAGLVLTLAGALVIWKPLRAYALHVQLINVASAVVAIAILVVNSGDHYAYIASGLLIIIGAQQAFYRTVDLAFTFALGFATHAAWSAMLGTFWMPMNLVGLGTFGAGYVIGFIPGALRIGIQRSELRNRLMAQRAQQELEQVQAITHLGNWTYDIATGGVEWSRELRQIFGVDADADVDGLYKDSIHPDDLAEYIRNVERAHDAGDPFTLDHRIIVGDTVRWVELHGKYEFDEHGTATHWVGAVLDISARKEAENALQRLARFDMLTGLPNRAAIHQMLSDEVARAERDGTTCAVAFVDLDRFKDVNDTLGHEIGDRLLRDISRRLAWVLGMDGVLARWGGDEFVVIVPAARDDAAVASLAMRLVHAAGEPFAVDDLELAVTASVGIAMYPRDGDDAGILIRNADTAMYKAKQELGCGYAFFSDALHAAASSRHNIRYALRKAIADDDLLLHFQPIVGAQDRRIVAAEALVRWRGHDGQLHMPAEFMSVAEDSRIIVPLGTWVLNAACRQSVRWRSQGFDIIVALNVSPRQFAHPDFVETVASALRTTGADPSSIEIEITEAAIMSNIEPVLATLRAVHAMGIRVAIDDFGTGYSSFAYLKRFEVSSLKIDRTFVDGIEENDNLAIAAAIVSVAHALRLPVTAEGVETPAQAQLLTDLGCDRLQGYYFGRPVPISEFESELPRLARV